MIRWVCTLLALRRLPLNELTTVIVENRPPLTVDQEREWRYHHSNQFGR